MTLPRHRAVADCFSISALRGTEILEWTLIKRLQALTAAATAAEQQGMSKSPSADGIAAIGKSLTDMFSWGSNSSSAVPPKSPRHAPSHSAGANNGVAHSGASIAAGGVAFAAGVDPKFRNKVLKIRAVLCPLKIRFAMLLADFGLVKEAAAYAMEARNLVQEVGTAGM